MKKAVEFLKQRLEDIILEDAWDSENLQAQEKSRALFTAICYLEDIEADTKPCDDYLWYLYDLGDIKDYNESFDDFQSFMVELIV